MEILLPILVGIGLTIVGFVLWTRHFSFAAQTPGEYANTGPDFDVRTHLAGPILCEGVIYGPTGRVASRFVADMEGNWDGNHGVLKEHFRYDSGRTQDRQWSLTVGNDGGLRAEAEDLVGTGTGTVSGGTVQMKYRIKMPQEAGGHELDVTDWMYLVENGTIVNRSQFRKFGVKVAELVATMRPKEAA